MTIIDGKCVVFCPEKQRDVTVHKDCTNINSQHDSCEFFGSFSLTGFRCTVVCKSLKAMPPAERLKRAL